MFWKIFLSLREGIYPFNNYGIRFREILDEEKV